VGAPGAQDYFCCCSWRLINIPKGLIKKKKKKKRKKKEKKKYLDAKAPRLACFGALASEYFMNC